MNQVTSWKRDEARDPRPLSAESLAHDLDDELATLFEAILDWGPRRCTSAGTAHREHLRLSRRSVLDVVRGARDETLDRRRSSLPRKQQVRRMKEGVPLLAHVEERGLYPRKDLRDARLDDVGDRERRTIVLDPKLHRDAVLTERGQRPAAGAAN